MSSEKAYVEEIGPRGKFAIAARDIKAGEMVSEEVEPLLFFRNDVDDAEVMKYACFDGLISLSGMDSTLPAFSNFMRETSLEKQRKFLNLFGPTTGTTAENMRTFASNCVKLRYKANEEYHKLTPDEVEKYVKVYQVTRMHGQGAKEIGYRVYEEVCLFGHSCDSNIKCVLQDQVARCYAKRSIKAGEKMTIPCISHRDLEPIHERRCKYLQTKEFTCHCPRCDALGDDTRQFDCVDPSCPGVMMARQPLNQWKIVPTHLFYTGVEYEAPQLLPCTVCHRAAPADYHTKMFQAEVCLPIVAEGLLQRFLAFIELQGPQNLIGMLQVLYANKIARRHAAMLPLLRLEFRIKFLLCQMKLYPAREVQEAAQSYISALETLFPRGHNEILTEIAFVALTCCSGVSAPVLPPQEEKLLCQKALRMHLLFKGRNNRASDLDSTTARVLIKLPPTATSEVCSFCEESPQRAAMKRSRCGQCKKVVYCSTGSQKAHWPQHKKTCKALG